MKQTRPGLGERKELKVRITQSLHDRLTAEAREAGLSLNALVTLGVARELMERKSRRKAAADRAVLAGQIDIEGRIHA